jgi:hypothetical protein
VKRSHAVTNARAEALLDKQGIRYEREPIWIKNGQKPDFYCHGRPNFWCEVKTLEPLPDSKELEAALAVLRNRTSNVSEPGFGIAYIGHEFDHRGAKAVAHLVKRAVRRFCDLDAPEVAIALIPSDPSPREFVRFSFGTKDHTKVEVHSSASLTGMYGTISSMRPEPDGQMIRPRFASGQQKELSAEKVVKTAEDFRVAVVIYRHDTPFEVVSAMPAGGGQKLNNPGRIREAVSAANDQFKNAINYKAGPCLLMIFQDGLDVPDDTIIKSALHGNLKYEFPKGHPEKGRLILDQDGAWNSTKNRTTSAVMYVRNSGEPLVIHNYCAYRPLLAGIFSCREVAVLPDGTFDEVDFLSGIAGWIPSCRRHAFRARQKCRARSAS